MAVLAPAIDERIAPTLRGLVESTEPALARVLGNSIDRVTATWSPGEADEQGSPTARLSLTDSGVTRTTDLTACELGDQFRLQGRIYQVWRDTLRERTRVQWQRVFGSLAGEQGG